MIRNQPPRPTSEPRSVVRDRRREQLTTQREMPVEVIEEQLPEEDLAVALEALELAVERGEDISVLVPPSLEERVATLEALVAQLQEEATPGARPPEVRRRARDSTL